MRPTAPLILSLVLGSGCAAVPPSDSDALLAWAEQVAAELRTRDLHDHLEETLANARTTACPEVDAAAPPLPLWYPERVTNDPSVGSAYPTPPGEGAHPGDSWAGGCSTDTTAWSGSAFDAALTASQAPCMFGPDTCATSSEWWEFDGLALTSLSGEASEQELAVGGHLYVLDDEWESGTGCASRGWETSSYRGGALTVEHGSLPPEAPVTLGPGLTTLDWAWDTLQAKHPYGFGCVPGQWSTLRASIEWTGESNRTLDADLLWHWSEGDGAQAEPEGCALEPLSGTLDLSDVGAPDADAVTVLVTFDGETTCDGCGALSVNGEAAGSWCPTTGFASP